MKCVSFSILIVFLIAAPPSALSQKTNGSAVIAIFLGVDCPISQQYISTLNRIYLESREEGSLKWNFIVSRHVSRRSLREFSRDFLVQFPICRDDKKSTKTKYFDARVTPEVVIIQGGETVYKGAIDNWFYHLGRHRVRPTEHYLADAIDSILRNERPTIRETKAIGCFIESGTRRNAVKL